MQNSDVFLLLADTSPGIAYAIHKAAFVPGSAYTAAVAGTTGFVGRLDLSWGELTRIVTGFQSPHGMAFVPTGPQNEDDEESGACPRRD